MKKALKLLVVVITMCVAATSCTTAKLNTGKLRTMYEKRINKTSILNKLFFNDHKKKRIIYEDIEIFMNENEVNKEFDVIAFGRYTPIQSPLGLLRPESRSLEHNLFYKAAKMAYDNKCDAAIIDSKNDFRIIRYR